MLAWLNSTDDYTRFKPPINLNYVLARFGQFILVEVVTYHSGLIWIELYFSLVRDILVNENYNYCLKNISVNSNKMTNSQ